MADLKTRRAVKGTVKTIDRAAVAAERLKSAAVRTKDAAERSATPAETSSQEYGAQQLERTAQGTGSELGIQFRKRGLRGFSDARRNADKARAQMQKCRDVLRENKSKKAVQAVHTPKPEKTVRTGARPVQRTGRIVIKRRRWPKVPQKRRQRRCRRSRLRQGPLCRQSSALPRQQSLPQKRLLPGQRLSLPLSQRADGRQWQLSSFSAWSD